MYRRGFLRSEKGAVIVLFALLVTVAMGIVGLAVDGGMWYATRRHMQAATDAAALGATYAQKNALPILAAGRDNAVVNWAPVLGSAPASAQACGATLPTGTSQVLCINSPPQHSRYHNGDAHAVEAILAQPARLTLAGLFINTVPVRTYAVATASTSPLDVCILALSPSASPAIRIGKTGGGTVQVGDANQPCTVWSKSTGGTTITMGASINSYVYGNVGSAGGVDAVRPDGDLQVSGQILDHNSSTVDNPYAGITPPSTAPAGTPTYHAAGNQVYSASNGAILQPGYYDQGLSISGSVTLDPGTYYIAKSLTTANQSNITGDGVTLVILDTMDLGNGNNGNQAGTLNITAPDSGTYAGIAIMGPHDATFSNNLNLNLDGAIYFPSGAITMNNNVETGADGCVQIISWTIALYNNVHWDTNCSSDITVTSGPARITLVE